ncbi:MAG: hypothetical protein Phog2KO_22160 [Phototrophicaceae bacterium]
MFRNRMIAYVFGMLCLLFFNPQTYAISQVGTLYLNWNCTLQTNQFGSFYSVDSLLTGTFDANDWNSVDSFGFQFRDSRGVIISGSGTSAPTGSTQYSQSWAVPAVQLGIDISSIQNPLTIEIYEDTGAPGAPYGNLLTTYTNYSPCFSTATQTATAGENESVPIIPIDPVILEEQANGITRVLDDGIVIARQPNGDYQYYTPDGCLIGYTPNETITSTSVYTRRIVQSVEGCEGYTVDLWSLGNPACQLQINAYLPDGRERVYEGFASFSETTRCQREFEYEVCIPDTSISLGSLLEPDVADGCITGASPDIAQVIFINGIRTSLSAHIGNRLVVERINLGPVMGIYNGGLSNNVFNTSYLSDATNTLINYLTNTTHPITIIAHSQGGAVVSDALQALEGTSRFNNITIYTFGSPATEFPDRDGDRHCAFSDDRVSTFSRDVPNYVELAYSPELFDAHHSFNDYMAVFDVCITSPYTNNDD